MRSILLLISFLAACSQEPSAPTLKTGTFGGVGRDRLCISGEPGAYQAGLIVFGSGDVNCSASGRLESQGTNWMFVPKGEGHCRIPLKIEASKIVIGQVPAACSYYCGAGTSLAGKSFSLGAEASEAVDLAGDPLC